MSERAHRDGGDKDDGFAVGDARITETTFSGGGSTGAALLVEDDAGGDKSIWAFKGETRLAVEMITPRK